MAKSNWHRLSGERKGVYESRGQDSRGCLKEGALEQELRQREGVCWVLAASPIVRTGVCWEPLNDFPMAAPLAPEAVFPRAALSCVPVSGVRSQDLRSSCQPARILYLSLNDTLGQCSHL